MSLTRRRADYRKAAVAVVSASVLALAACGSEEEGNSTAETVTSSASSSSVAPSSSVTSTSSTTVETEEPTAAPAPAPVEEPVQEQPEAAAQDAESDVSAQAEQLPMETFVQTPIEGGQAASPEDAEAITALINGINDETTLRGFMGYIPNHACSRAMANAQDLDINQIPDINLADFPEFQNAKASIDSVDNIVVNGDQASASVTTSHNGVSETGVQRFLREGDRWTFCD